MKTIKNITRDITINGYAIITTQNIITYEINTTIDNYSYCIELFPNMNGQSIFNKGYFTYSNSVHIPNLPDIMEGNKVETTDVGKSGTELTKDFATTTIYMTNAFSLDMKEWELI